MSDSINSVQSYSLLCKQCVFVATYTVPCCLLVCWSGVYSSEHYIKRQCCDIYCICALVG
jgi:hypothetical protein